MESWKKYLIVEMLTLLPSKRLDLQPEELKEGEVINTNKEGDCDENNQEVSEEVTLKLPTKFPLREFSEILHNIESTKDEMLEADADLKEMNITVYQGMKKMLALNYNYAMTGETQSKLLCKF